MSTGTKFISLSPNRLIEIDDLESRMFDYLDDQHAALAGRVYDSPGVFGVLGIDPLVSGEFDILGDALATDGLGRLLDPSSASAY